MHNTAGQRQFGSNLCICEQGFFCVRHILHVSSISPIEPHFKGAIHFAAFTMRRSDHYMGPVCIQPAHSWTRAQLELHIIPIPLK